MPPKPRAPLQFPNGTVTFLFTDIEGSTRLWETQSDAMQKSLAQHDALLRDAIDANDGYLVKTTGDGGYAAFAIATNALGASLALQRTLNARAAGDLPFRARIALHSGEAELRDGDYFGATLNRAARLMAAGHGGQILLSSATERLVRDHLPTDIALRDMGERRMKDLLRPEHIYQVVTPGLKADFPPLKTLDARANNLPAQTTPFIGRELAISAIRKRLGDANVRLLTLSGVGGTGKTRLALQVAAQLLDEFENGVYFVPLASLSDPALVLQAVADTLAVREAAGETLQKRLENYLRDKQMLIVLDNFEQVIEAASRVNDLLSVAPRLKVLVTSRELLRLSGETDYPVSPLSIPDPKLPPPLEQLMHYEAVALFVERAVAVNATFAVTSENAGAVVGICNRLDGLPLALELAAARMRGLSAQRIEAGLRHRLSFLKGGARDLPTRQQTLRGAIDWSHALLTNDEQRLFRRLAVFVGGCELDAIEAVCNIDSDPGTIETVESLVGKSLLTRIGDHDQTRVSMLETIREYAVDRLGATDEGEILRAQHHDYFLALAEEAASELEGNKQGKWLRRLDDELENLRAALDYSVVSAELTKGLRLCVALRPFWVTRGNHTEGRARCAQLLEKIEPKKGTAEHASLLNAAGTMAHAQAEYPAAKTFHAAALAIWRDLGNRKAIASSLLGLGNIAHYEGDFSAAKVLFEESLAIVRELGERGRVARLLVNLGNVNRDQGHSAASRALQEEALAVWRELRHGAGIAFTLLNLGVLLLQQDDIASAQSLFKESLTIARELGERVLIAAALTNLGDIALDRGDLNSAWGLHAECVAIAREVGDKRLIATSLEGLAAAVAALGDPLRAARGWGAVERLRNEINSPMAPNERLRYERQLAAARVTSADGTAFERAWKQGGALTCDQAIDLALAERAG